METVSHHGRETAYRRVEVGKGGDGAEEESDDRAVLYVHGSGGTHRLWAAQYGTAGPHHPAVALDLSGHGDSEDVDAEPGPDALSAYAEDVVAVAETTDASVLVGNSLGGAVTLQVALATDFEPEALVLAGTGAKLAVHDDIRGWLREDFERTVEFLHGEDRLFHDPDERVLQQSRRAMREVGQRVTRRDFLTCHEFDVRADLSAIDVPALAVVGEHDGLTPPSYHEYLAEELPDCDYAEIPDAAHLAMAERPEAFKDAMEEFLDSVW